MAFADWRPMYQQENCDEMFTEFNEIFESILDQHAFLQICDSSIKRKTKNGTPWIPMGLTKLIAEKHHLYNRYKFSQNYDIRKPQTRY